MSDELRAALALVRKSGYLVVRIPDCKRPGDHGRHSLITRSAMCEGKGVIPHGVQSGSFGTFGYWVHCQCGHSFADYGPEGELTNWQKHAQENGIEAKR